MPTESSQSQTSDLDRLESLYKLYSDTAKSYIQVASAALALPLILREALFGESEAKHGLIALGVPWQLTTSWVCFLFTILLGLLYQWLVVRRLWDTYQNPNSRFQLIKREWIYGPMLLLFYSGAFFFVWFAYTLMSNCAGTP